MSRKKGQTIHSEAREVVKKVIQECDEESESGHLIDVLTNTEKQMYSNYCGISERSVSKIRKEGIEAGENVLSTPGKKRPRAEKYKFHCYDFNRTVIRNLFIEFYQVKKIVPTAPKLLKEIRNRIDFPWEVDTLRKLLHSMGFKWKKFRTSTPAQRLM
ncbi:hypothetical protein C0J52_08364 [Blattella germanica]|nr:hypothetical protein C0J52_08364 [Blattella germanica]